MESTDILLRAFKKMLTIRHAENMIAEDFRKNKIFSFLHLYTGQEAVATGACMALRIDDRVFGNHRSHGHYLAKGGNLYRMFCEIYGKADGCCNGMGGSMHVLDRSVGFMGSTPILGSAVPIAAGSAFQQKVACDRNITVVFFGDGASEEGVVYETLNIAALWKLPILFVLENNFYSVASAESARRSDKFDRERLVRSLGLDYCTVNGNSFTDVYKATTAMRENAVDGCAGLLEARVFRHMAHSGPIADEDCRTFDTKDLRERADCIKQLMAELSSRGVHEDSLEEINALVLGQVAEAFFHAKEAAMPTGVPSVYA